jgi:hypothetical protein
MVACNERGCRIGENHQRAKLSDHEVELLRARAIEMATRKAHERYPGLFKPW